MEIPKTEITEIDKYLLPLSLADCYNASISGKLGLFLLPEAHNFFSVTFLVDEKMLFAIFIS